MSVVLLEAKKMTFVVGYNQGYKRMKAYGYLHAYACSHDYSPLQMVDAIKAH